MYTTGKKISILSVFICITSILFFLVSPLLTYAEETDDPFEKIDTQINILAQEIQGSQTGAGCEFLSGNKMVQYYNRSSNGFNALAIDMNEMLFSTCYSATVQRIDADIQRKILTPFASSGMACKKISGIQDQIDDLIQLRWELRPSVAKLPKSISQKYCKADRRSTSLEQTSQTWKELQKKFEDLKKRMQDTSSSQTQKQKDATLLQEEKASKARKLRIKKQAEQRIQSFVNEFIQNSIIAPLYAERSKINQNLRSLPNGNSRFVTAKPLSISDMFFPPKNKNGESFWSNIFQESISTKISDISTQNKSIEKNISTFSKIIVQKKDFDDKLDLLKKRLKEDLESQESSREFSEAYSQAIIDSLSPFHTTLQTSEKTMIQKTKLLEKTLNRQNVTVR